MDGDDLLYIALASAILLPLALKGQMDKRAAKENARARWVCAVLLVGALGLAAPYLVSALTDTYLRAKQPPPPPIWSPYSDPRIGPTYDPTG